MELVFERSFLVEGGWIDRFRVYDEYVPEGNYGAGRQSAAPTALWIEFVQAQIALFEMEPKRSPLRSAQALDNTKVPVW